MVSISSPFRHLLVYFLLSLLISSPSLFSIIFCPLMGHISLFVVVWGGTRWKCFKKTDEMRLFCLIVANKSGCNFSQGSHLLGSLQGPSSSSAVSQKTLSQAAGGVIMTQQFEMMTTRGRSRVENGFIFSILAEMGCTMFGTETAKQLCLRWRIFAFEARFRLPTLWFALMFELRDTNLINTHIMQAN